MDSHNTLRRQLLDYLENSHTHVSLDDAVKDFPEEMINQKAENAPYTFWGLLEHIRATQSDMLEFVKSSDYKEKEWPEDYWPDPNYVPEKGDWDKTLAEYKKDLAEF